jgi:hypothetical protein
LKLVWFYGLYGGLFLRVRGEWSGVWSPPPFFLVFGFVFWVSGFFWVYLWRWLSVGQRVFLALVRLFGLWVPEVGCCVHHPIDGLGDSSFSDVVLK